MKTARLILLLSLIFGAGGNIYCQGGEERPIEIFAKPADKTKGPNPNVVGSIPTTDQPEITDKPKGLYCSVKFDNLTRFHVRVYVDGYEKGLVPPKSQLSVTVFSGYTKIYCITTGGTKEWKATGSCDGNYVYKLNIKD